MILLESLLSNEYFDDIIETEPNKYIKKNTFDTTQPLITQKYSNEITQDINVDTRKGDTCRFKIGNVDGIWSKLFPENSKYRQYNNTSNNCSYELILMLLTVFDNTISSITVQDLKDILIEKYKELYSNNYEKLLEILITQNKNKYVMLLKNSTTTIEKMILDTEYYLSNFDILLIIEYFNIPIVLFSDNDISESLLTKSKSKNIYVPSKSDEYYFIFCKKNKKNIVNYKLVLLENTNPKIALSMLASELKEKIINNIKPNIFDLLIENIPTNIKIKPRKISKSIKLT